MDYIRGLMQVQAFPAGFAASGPETCREPTGPFLRET
jgi:hypothetical protein